MIDLRSDTVTLPTEAMREAMARAELGDDSRERDPTVVRLEELAATMTGKDAAMFVTSGTMANLVSLLAHGRGGGDVLLEAESHILRSEVGGIARLTGLFHRTVPGTRGAPDLDAVRDLISAPSVNSLGTALVCVETTHNSAGGAVIPLAHLAKLRALTAEKGIPLHIDGARVFNAAVKLGVPASEIAKHGDSIVFCVSKGLVLRSAPSSAARRPSSSAHAPFAAWSAVRCVKRVSWRRRALSRLRRWWTAWPTITRRQRSLPRASTASTARWSIRTASRPTS